jgi:hypothetical protein
MIDYRRRQEREVPRRKLVRGPDGRLRSSGEGDIGDIWAEQKRLRLAEAILEDKRRADKKAQRSAKISRFKHMLRPSRRKAVAEEPPKERIVTIDLPRLRLPTLRLKGSKKKRLAVSGAVLVIVVGGAAGLLFLPDNKANKQQPTRADVLSVEDLRQSPDFQAILPSGKTIEDLGGWLRVSPPDKDPVFAFVDTVEGAQLNVSQQRLPDDFKQDAAGELAELANQFGAKEKITVDQVDAYIGTSAKGPQSVLMVKSELLILIRASSALTNEQWVVYIASLH